MKPVFNQAILILALTVASSMPARAAPTLMENVHGYTLAGDRMQTRTDHGNEPKGGWHIEQAMTLEEAFRAFTLDAAYAQHQEKSIGSLETGKWADFIVVDRDPFKIAPADLWKVKVEQTWVAGERVF